MTTTTAVKNFVIDFDSTFSSVEALDILGKISLKGRKDHKDILQQIAQLTDLAMSGKLSFRESLSKRLDLLDAHQEHLPILVKRLKKLISKSFKRNKQFLKKNADNIYIISNGFKEFIFPIVSEYGIDEQNVHANTFVFSSKGKIVGFDENNVLSQGMGKPAQIDALNLGGEIFVIGDGYNDYEIRKEGKANRFYAFTENVKRQNVMDSADHIAPSFDEILYHNQMKGALSYPKNRIKILLLENIHAKGVAMFEEEGYQIEIHPASLTEDELAAKIKNVSILGLRSKTQITKKVLEKASRLMSIGAFCIGTNQIDLDECLQRGIAVFNAPYSNTRSVVELAISQMIMLIRQIPDKIAEMHQGKWNKSASGSFEIRGKKLGIVGYGNIGKQLSVLAESIGLEVYYFDLEERLALGNARKCRTLAELLKKVDIVSLHVDGRQSNRNIFGSKEFGYMKKGTIFMNLSRGHIVDIKVLKKNIESGKIKGAAIDVFPDEPLSNQHEFISELRGLPNTILTPHIGGSTLEAQENIAEFVPGKIIDYINSGSTANSVNFPNLKLPTLKNAHRFIHIHRNQPGILAHITNTLASHGINVVGQYLKTNELIGYVITDIGTDYQQEVIAELKKIEGTIRFRVLY